MADMDEGFRLIEAGSKRIAEGHTLIAEGHALITHGFGEAIDGRKTLKAEMADLKETIDELRKLIFEQSGHINDLRARLDGA